MEIRLLAISNCIEKQWNCVRDGKSQLHNQQDSKSTVLNIYLSREQAMKLYNTVIISSVNYCPLVWMFCGKGANHKINSTHKRALIIIHSDYDSSLDKHLKKSDTATIHIKNLQKLMLEIYKSMNHLIHYTSGTFTKGRRFNMISEISICVNCRLQR